MNKQTFQEKQKFYIIAHNAADTHKDLAPWKTSQASHLEIDVQQTHSGFLAMHSRITGFLNIFRLWPFAMPLDRMIAAVLDQNKNIYIDYKTGSIDALFEFLRAKQILSRCTFVVYGRDRAERLKRLAPNNDVFLHIGKGTVQVFDQEPNIYHIGVCLPPKLLTSQNVSYMKQNHAAILATYINSFTDAMNALALEVAGITTDMPQLADLMETYRTKVKKSDVPSQTVASSSTL